METESERNGTGTAVTVEDFMYSMPVRRNRINEVLDMEEIKNQLQYLAIIHYNVCFTLRNENKGVILLQTPQAPSMIDAIKNIFGRSVANSLTSLHCQDQKYEITGFISIKSQMQNSLQLIYINRRIVTKGVIHKFINNLIKEYNKKENLLPDTPTGQIIKSLKIPSSNAFIILIKCPQQMCELFRNIRKTTVEFKNWTEILKCVHRAVRGAFKSVLNFDSSNSQQEIDNVEGDNEERRAFGTSLLLNAVRGAPAKRELDSRKDTRKKKKLKLSNSNKNVKTLPRKDNSKEVVKIQNEQDNLIDSLESPIPKRSLKCGSGLIKNKTINQSFLEFYEWLKTKFESDTNAFKLYNDFLQFKSRTNQPKIPEFKSPVLGGKLKRKKALSKNKLKKPGKKVLGGVCTLDEEMAVVMKNQLKIFPNSQLRVKRGVQFTTEMHSGLTETLKVAEGLNFEKCNGQLVFKKAEGAPGLKRNQKQVEYNHTITSSEVQFSNFIKFRNLTESFCQQSIDIHVKPPPEKLDSSASGTWLSHYQASKNAEVMGKESEISQRNDLCTLTQGSFGFSDFANTITRRDVEIQVEILKPVEKVNAIVQTNQAVPETPENSGEGSPGNQNIQLLEENLIQEVPEPYFWNTSEYIEATDNQFASKKTPKNGDTNERNSISAEFVCGHRSHTSSKPQNDRSTSKETQTIACIWTESLTRLEYPTETQIPAADHDLSNLKSADLPKTIPNEEVECTEPRFYLTERHNFVPKGLSPEVFIAESAKITALSPNERNKIKLTIDNAQNDVLGSVKWGDESTGDCLKPKIPSGIFFEMNRKAGEDGMNYGDPVLTASLSYCAVKVHNLLHSFTFTKELLSGTEILGQLDKKFIATLIKISAPKKMELISLFDQHAVDERIKLEELINENVTAEGKFISSCLNPPVECNLAESDVRLVLEFRDKILTFGLSFEPVNESTILLTQAPSFLVNKLEKDLRNKKETSFSDSLKSLLLNVLEELSETRGAGLKTPKVLHNAFCLDACHKAIKFNKALSIEKMTEMISKLQRCTLPFQCAHGRPSVIPIIDLEDFKPAMEEKENIDLKKLKKFFNERKEDDIIENSENS